MPDTPLRTSRPLLSLIALCAALVPAALYAIFVYAPVEQQMGVAQRIFYFHVPCAICMELAFFGCGIASFIYLVRRSTRWDALAMSLGEVGMLLFACVITTGPLWARKAWGVYWTWDPRLTSTLVAGMIFLAYLVLRTSRGVGEVERRFAAALAILGALDIPIIKYSVERWRGTHPQVITGAGGGIHPDMRPGLVFGFAFILTLSCTLVWLRVRSQRIEERLAVLEELAASRGLDEG